MEEFYVSGKETKESANEANDIETKELDLSGLDEKQEPLEILSDTELKQIQDELNTEQDVISSPDGQEDFAKMIDSMSLDELREERERLVEWGVLDDEVVEKQQAAEDEFNSRFLMHIHTATDRVNDFHADYPFK